jgi:hypothetical protein
MTTLAAATNIHAGLKKLGCDTPSAILTAIHNASKSGQDLTALAPNQFEAADAFAAAVKAGKSPFENKTVQAYAMAEILNNSPMRAVYAQQGPENALKAALTDATPTILALLADVVTQAETTIAETLKALGENARLTDPHNPGGPTSTPAWVAGNSALKELDQVATIWSLLYTVVTGTTGTPSQKAWILVQPTKDNVLPPAERTKSTVLPARGEALSLCPFDEYASRVKAATQFHQQAVAAQARDNFTIAQINPATGSSYPMKAGV